MSALEQLELVARTLGICILTLNLSAFYLVFPPR